MRAETLRFGVAGTALTVEECPTPDGDFPGYPQLASADFAARRMTRRSLGGRAPNCFSAYWRSRVWLLGTTGLPVGLHRIRWGMEASFLDRISHGLNEVVKYLAAVLLASMTTIVFLQVLFRYVLNHPLDWSEELGSFAFVWMSLLGASIGLKRNEHPRLDLIVNLFPSKTQKTIAGLYNIAILFLLAVLFIYGVRLTVSMKSQLTAALQYSVSFVYAVLPVSAAIMFIHLAIQTVGLFLAKNQERKK